MAKKKTTDIKQKDLVVVMILSLALGLGGGFVIGAAVDSDSTEKNQANSEMEKMSSGHSHAGMFMVSADEAPTVEVVVVEDEKSGYNVKLITEDFSFTPDSVNGENVIGEGHAHLYVDGEKVGRLYSPDFHYSGNFEGTKTFRVTLNANDHSEYAVDGEAISAETDVTHDSSDPMHNEMHSDDDQSRSNL